CGHGLARRQPVRGRGYKGTRQIPGSGVPAGADVSYHSRRLAPHFRSEALNARGGADHGRGEYSDGHQDRRPAGRERSHGRESASRGTPARSKRLNGGRTGEAECILETEACTVVRPPKRNAFSKQRPAQWSGHRTSSRGGGV